MAESVKLEEGYFHFWGKEMDEPVLVMGFNYKDTFRTVFRLAFLDGTEIVIPLSDLVQGESLVPVTPVETAKYKLEQTLIQSQSLAISTEAAREDRAKQRIAELEHELAEGVRHIEGMNGLLKQVEHRCEQAEALVAKMMNESKSQ